MAVAEATGKENLYEGMFLLDSGKFSSDADRVTRNLHDILGKAGATVVAERPWQDGRLAYEIDGHRKGLHYLVYFRMPGSGVAEITRLCKLSDTVIRQMVLQHEPKLFDAMVAALSPEAAAEEGEESAGSGKEKDSGSEKDTGSDGEDPD